MVVELQDGRGGDLILRHSGCHKIERSGHGIFHSRTR